MVNIMESTARGHKAAQFEDLGSMPVLTEASSTYTPLPHLDFAMNVHRIGEEILGPKGFSLNGAQYTVSADMGKLYMAQAFDHDDREDLKLMVAGRNSTDKSMMAAVAVGAQVTICTNGIISGEISVMRKHTGDVFRYLEDNLILSFHRATAGWNDLQADIEKFKETPLDDREAYRIIGEMWGDNILLPNHLNKVRKHWHEDDDFADKSLWSLYNAATEAFKGLPPQKIMQSHLALHTFAREQVTPETPETAHFSVGDALNN